LNYFQFSVIYLKICKWIDYPLTHSWHFRRRYVFGPSDALSGLNRLSWLKIELLRKLINLLVRDKMVYVFATYFSIPSGMLITWRREIPMCLPYAVIVVTGKNILIWCRHFFGRVYLGSRKWSVVMIIKIRIGPSSRWWLGVDGDSQGDKDHNNLNIIQSIRNTNGRS
jgi:hypothetical protein